MPIATASSSYVLEDRASSVLRGIRGEAQKTTVAAKATANALDRIGSPQQTQRLERFEKRLGHTAGSAESMSRRVTRTVGNMEGAIRRDTLKAEARLTGLEGRLDDLGRKRATPTVNLDGYAVASAQIASLQRQLDALGRRSASPRVAASLAGGALGGGGGAGRSGVAIGSGGASVFSTRTGLLAGAALTALPAVSALTGTILPLAGSLTGASLGAGAVGLAGGGALAAGIGAVTSVAKPAFAAVKELREEQEHLNEVVAQYGARSAQAEEAQRRLDAQIRKSPAGAQNLSRELTLLQKRWTRVTAPGQTDILGLGAAATHRLRSASPFLGAQANVAASATRRGGTNLAAFLTSPASLIVVRDLTRSFASNLDEAEGTLENVVGTFGNVARASTPFFHEGMVWLEHWTGGWESSTRDIGRTREQIGGYLNDLKAWGRLGGAGFDLIRDIIMPGRQQGTSVVSDLTSQLHEWDDWVKRNPERIRRFYHDSIEGTKHLAGFLGVVVHDVSQLASLLLPVLNRFAQLGQIGGGAGLLLPAALRIGLGRAMGGRGGRAGAAAGGGGVAAALGAPPVVVGGRGAESRRGAYPDYRVMTAAAGARVASARTDWTDWTGSPTQTTSRTAALRQRVAGGARSAARFAAPVAAINAAIGASGTQGTLGERAQGAMAGLTFGLLPGATTRADARAQGEARAIGDIEALNAPRSQADYARQITSLQRRRARAADAAHGEGSSFLGVGLHGSLVGGPQDAEMRRNAAATKKYTEAIHDLRAEARAYRREVDRRSGVASELHGSQLADSFQQAFAITRQRKGPAAALTETLDDVLRRMRRMRPEGAKVLGEATLAWAQQVAKGNPRLQAIVGDLTTGIESRFSRMGKHVQVVNGQILTGSRTEWHGIEKALVDPAERARQGVTAAFTAIQAQAIGSLRAMGYSTGEARALVKARERGGAAAQNDTLAGISASHGDTASSRRRAGGTGDGTGDGHGTARGRAGGGSAALMGADAGLAGYANEAARFGLHVSSGRRPGAVTSSGNTSLHASGNAIDEAGSADGMLRYAHYMATKYGAGLDELIHTRLGFGIKNGRRVPLSFWGPTINAGHYDHVHVGDRTPSGASGGATGSLAGGAAGSTAGAGRHVGLHAKRSGLHGVPGALADRATAMYAAGLEKHINARLGADGGGGGGGGLAGLGSVTGGGGTPDANRALARRMMLAYGGGKWGPDQWPPLNSLWTRESGFNQNARNASSGAFGIPQSLPASKMGPAAVSGNVAAQVRWGLGYIACVPLDTRILTRRGWLEHDEVRVGDETVGYNPTTGKSEWTAITAVHHYDDAPLVLMKGKRWASRSTPNHRWATEKYQQTPGDQGYRFEFARTDEIGTRHRIILAAPVADSDGLPITTTEAEFLGWLLGDGTIYYGLNNRGGKRGCINVTVTQIKDRYMHELRRVMSALPHSEYVYQAVSFGKQKTVYIFRLRSKYARDLLARSGYERDLEAMVLAMSTDQRRAFLQGFVYADGYVATNGRSPMIAQNVGPGLDAVMLVAYLLGHYCNPTGSIKHKHVQLTAKGAIKGGLDREFVGRAPVWCVTTMLGTWTAQQDGRAWITGNSRYGTPASAWGHSQAVNWYGRGGSGTVRKPTVIGIGDHPRGEDFKVSPRRLGPPSSRAGGHGGPRGLGTVTIQKMIVNWAREGDLKDAMKRELRQALEEFAVELDEGVSYDEDVLLR